MELIETHKLTPEIIARRGASDREQIYNALDAAVTFEILEALNRLSNQQPAIYAFERALQGPILEIMLRGIRVDQYERKKAIEALHGVIERLGGHKHQYEGKAAIAAPCGILQRYAFAIWNKPLNPNSSKQLVEFFYKHLHLPEIWISEKGVRKLSMNREVLEKLSQHYLAMPIVSAILAIREHSKSVKTLETEVDLEPDKSFRIRTSLNIAATETGRLSSSKNAFGSGGNMQNWKERLRRPMVADPGWKMGAIDLEQAESRELGFLMGLLFDDWSYLNSCECVTADHEVLTPNGWISIADKPSQLAIWESGKIRFASVQKWNESLTDTLISVESKTISLLATPNHEMPVFSYSRDNSYISRQSLEYIKTHPSFHSPLTGKWTGGTKSIPEAAILAAFQADGTRDAQGKVHFSFMKIRKIEAMRKILKDQNLQFSEYKLATGAVRFYIHAGQGQDKWNKHCGPEILDWDIKSLRAFCWSHRLWDASQTESNVSIVAKHKSHLQWLATAYTLVGNSVSFHGHKTAYWEMTIRNRDRTQYRSAKIRDVKSELPIAVYCPTVESGFFLIRRNNKIYISGNSGDLHTNSAKLVWPELEWTGDMKLDRKIAEKLFYRDFSFRDMAKRGGHGVNYLGTPWTMARHLKVPVKVMEGFQERYFNAFSSIPRLHRWVAQELQTEHKLTTYFGRERHFFGRPDDDATLREGVAFMGQSPTADRMNTGLLNVWTQHRERIRLLHQLHDAIYFQYRESEDENEIMRLALKACSVPVRLPNGRVFDVPGEAKIGWNMSKRHDDSKPLNPKTNPFNPDGLIKWRGEKDSRTRSVGMEMIL